MKVMICVWRLTHGGAERVASMWAKGFVQNGYSVDFLLGSYNSAITYDIPPGCNIYYECRVNDKISTRFVPEFVKVRNIRKILDQSMPDVIVCVMPSWGNKLRKVMKNQKKIPIIVSEHDSYERPDTAPMTKCQYKQKFITNGDFDIVTVLTQADRNFLVKKNGENFAKNTIVLPNPVSFEPAVEVPKKEKSILAVGRLDAWHYKGFDLLIEAWGRIASKYPDWVLNIAGDGKQERLFNVAKKCNVEKQVHFLGFLNPYEQYRKSAIFVLSSRYEGFGMVLTEAMSQGCACIACDYKGRQREIIENDQQGILIPVENVEKLSEAMDKMLSDDEFRCVCQKNAIKRSEYYSVRNITERWNAIFKAVNVL